MIACQSDGCAPIVLAFNHGQRFAKKVEDAKTIASGLRVPAAVGDFMILDAVRESGGLAVAAPENDIRKWMGLANAQEGIAICPEAAVCFGVLERLMSRGAIKSHERVLVFNTGAAQKYPEAIDATLPRLDISKPIDWTAI
jgi:threonine synthase